MTAKNKQRRKTNNGEKQATAKNRQRRKTGNGEKQATAKAKAEARGGGWMRFSFILVAVMSVVMGSQTPVLPAKSGAAVENSGRVELLDINTATAEQLRALPGMGEVYVRRIVAGRPYTAKNQLVTRGVIPQQEYERIQGRIVARRLQK